MNNKNCFGEGFREFGVNISQTAVFVLLSLFYFSIFGIISLITKRKFGLIFKRLNSNKKTHWEDWDSQIESKDRFYKQY